MGLYLDQKVGSNRGESLLRAEVPSVYPNGCLDPILVQKNLKMRMSDPVNHIIVDLYKYLYFSEKPCTQTSNECTRSISIQRMETRSDYWQQ